MTRSEGGEFWRSVVALAGTDRAALHMPGHGNRAYAGARLDPALYPLDQSEIGGLDYLHDPQGPLRLAQERAARLVGADRSWFLVNGATAGNHMALWAVARPGATVIMGRQAHQSAHAGAALAGLRPHHLAPLVDERLDRLHGVDLDALALALQDVQDVAAVHVTSPDYYGFRLPLEQIVELCHAAGVPLIVDEAHGAHLSFLDGEQTALRAGADLVVHSPHKSLGSLTQSAVLHQRGSLVDPSRVSEAAVMLQSSSPSSLLTMSLDAVFDEHEHDGPEQWNRLVALAHRAQAALASDGDPLFMPRLPLPAGTSGFDPCKLLVDSARYGCSSAQLRDLLLGSQEVRPELTDPRYLVFSVTRATSERDLLRLTEGLRAAADASGRCRATTLVRTATCAWPTALPQRVQSAQAAAQSSRVAVPLAEATGRVAARQVCPYPPGTPLVLPGEVIDDQVVQALTALLAADVTVRGLVLTASGPGLLCVEPAVPAQAREPHDPSPARKAIP